MAACSGLQGLSSAVKHGLQPLALALANTYPQNGPLAVVAGQRSAQSALNAGSPRTGPATHLSVPLPAISSHSNELTSQTAPHRQR